MNHGYFHREFPPELHDLTELGFDLRWNNCPAARHLYGRFDSEVWQRTENPVLVLQSASQQQIDAAVNDELLLSELDQWRAEVKEYYESPTEFTSLDPDNAVSMIAYFSMEFGLSESLPIYSGGLGMLAGDHLKTASDLGVPLVAIGLLYQQGYFRQVIGNEGKQLEAYPFNDPGSLPVRPVTDDDGQWLRIQLPLPGRTLFLRVWEVKVGRIRLFLLDSNDAMNTPWDRAITAQLYASVPENRLLQEIVLGVGGWRMVEQLGLPVNVCHLNEGHAAFAILARAAGFAQRHDLPLRTALAATRGGNVFTTHTPVEAAFDRFEPELLAHYAKPFLDEAGFSLPDLLALGRKDRTDKSESFNMAWLAMRGCVHVNAVSRLHAEISRDLIGDLYPRWPHAEIPVRAITNGVHVPTWASQRAAKLWGDGDGSHLWLDGLHHVSDRIRQTPAAELWAFRTAQRKALLEYVYSRQGEQTQLREGRRDRAEGDAHEYDAQESDAQESDATRDEMLDPNVLTIGFARRFATYKRATLLLSDPDRLRRLLLDEQRPIQLLIAGKAHPNDGFGKALVQQMTQFLRRSEFRNRAVFLDDYDMVLGQHLVAGVDVWLNTPLRPNEACGTSGMKVLANGGLNVSILDGWWDEIFDDTSGIDPGWIIGSRDTGSPEALARRDAESLFDVLENHVIPEFYDHDAEGIPHRWIDRVKESMARLTPRFSATRMLHEYIKHAYIPAAKAIARRTADGAREAQDILQWSDRVNTHWKHVRVGQVRCDEDEGGRTATVECWFDDVSSESISVQLYADGAGDLPNEVIPMRVCHELPGAVNGFLFGCEMKGSRPLSDYSVRVVPAHRSAFVPIENHCILWNR